MLTIDGAAVMVHQRPNVRIRLYSDFSFEKTTSEWTSGTRNRTYLDDRDSLACNQNLSTIYYNINFD